MKQIDELERESPCTHRSAHATPKALQRWGHNHRSIHMGPIDSVDYDMISPADVIRPWIENRSLPI